MASVGEKIFDEIWGGLNPIFSIQRAIMFFLFCIALSSLSDYFFTFNIFKEQLGRILELTQKVFSDIALWKISFAFIVSFIFGPFLGYFINRYWTESNHINKADKFKDNGQVIQQGTNIKELAEIRNQGIKKINFLKSIGEILSSVLIIYFYWLVIHHANLGESLVCFFAGLLSWAALMYLVSQRIFIVFMTDIYPFNLSIKN